MKASTHNVRSYFGRETRPGNVRKRPGTLLGIPRFRHRHAAPILIAPAAAPNWFTGAETVQAPPPVFQEGETATRSNAENTEVPETGLSIGPPACATNADVDAPAAALDTPTVEAAISGGHSSQALSRTESNNSGPDVEDYDLRCGISGSSGDFTEVEYEGDDTSVTITGPDANTTYGVPVRGTNDEAHRPWAVLGRAWNGRANQTIAQGRNSSGRRLGRTKRALAFPLNHSGKRPCSSLARGVDSMSLSSLARSVRLPRLPRRGRRVRQGAKLSARAVVVALDEVPNGIPVMGCRMHGQVLLVARRAGELRENDQNGGSYAGL